MILIVPPVHFSYEGILIPQNSFVLQYEVDIKLDTI